MNRTVFLSDLTSHSYGSRTPSAPAKEGFAAFIDGAATPPNLGGEFRVTFRVHDHSHNEVQKLETPMRTPLLTTSEKMANLQTPPFQGGESVVRIQQLRHQHYRRLPERYLLPGGIQNRYLAVVFAGRKFSERETEL